jgi:dihydroorotate dehydrogenase
MSMLSYERLILPLLIRRDAERSHRIAIHVLRLATVTPGGLSLLRTYAPAPDPRLNVKCFGLDFPNPLGVAAGLDKDAEAIAALFALGFGAVETGTVTPVPQPGNTRPRVWRVPEHRAVINAMGFPSGGMHLVKRRVAGRRFPGVLGINLGKNRHTPIEDAVSDYLAVLDLLWPESGYLTINVSSPNTPGLRELQGRDALATLVRAVQERNRDKAEIYGLDEKPVLVKIAPDLDDAALDDVLAGAVDGGASGLIISNTTVDRSAIGAEYADLPGGLSGAPLRDRANSLVSEAIRRLGKDRIPIIGVGGISTANEVIERMQAGASLVQIYTGFVYVGPGMPGSILRDLSAFCDREGVRSITELTDNP